MVRQMWDGLRVLLLLSLAMTLTACMGGPAIYVTYDDVFPAPAPPPVVAPSHVEQRTLPPLAGTTVRPAPAVVAPPRTYPQRGLPTYRASDGSGLTIGYNTLSASGVSVANLITANPLTTYCPYSVFYDPSTKSADAVWEDQGKRAGRAIFVLTPTLDNPRVVFMAAHECAHLLMDHRISPEDYAAQVQNLAPGELPLMLDPAAELAADLMACRMLKDMGMPDVVEAGIALIRDSDTGQASEHSDLKQRVTALEQCLAA